MSPEPRDPEKNVVALREEVRHDHTTGTADTRAATADTTDVTIPKRAFYGFHIANDVDIADHFINPKRQPDPKDRRRAFQKFIRGNRRY
jgi:hypothetical protein